MKLYQAILKGMERFPKPAIGTYQAGNSGACVMGCANYAVSGDTRADDCSFPDERTAFSDYYGVSIFEANDGGIPREDIAGMCKHLAI